MRNGHLNLLKPPGMTSSDAVVLARRRFRGDKTGHAGTLDPEAAGVLPVLVGKATRLADYVMDKQKVYLAEIALGVTTDTQDAQGVPLERREVTVGEAELRAALPEFVGTILQTPPMVSAIKSGGKRLYQLAREGATVEVPPREVDVDALEFVRRTGKDRYLLRVTCGRGFYVRTLCHDIGRRLGCGAHMSFLLRTRCGPFDIARTVTVEELMNAPEEGLSGLLLPMDAPLAAFGRVDLPGAMIGDVRNGRALALRGLSLPDAKARTGEALVRVYCAGEFCAMAQAEGDWLKYRCVLV